MDSQNAFRSLTAGIRFNKNKLPKRAEPQVHWMGTTSFDHLCYKIADLKAYGASKSGVAESNKSKKRKRAAGEAQAATIVDSPSLRKSHKIRCTGDDLPDIWPEFTSFPDTPPEVLQNLLDMNVSAPTPIQMQASSIIYSNRDLLACAPTGSGKTLAFLLPLLLRSAKAKSTSQPAKGPRAIVLEPTRELARQVYTEAGKIRKGTQWKVDLLGERGPEEQDEEEGSEAEDGGIAGNRADVLITTPLKLIFALKKKQIDLSGVEYLVLDEADRLFELNFVSQTDEIISACSNPSLRKAMFSATIPSGVEELAKSVMSSDVIRVIIGGSDSATTSISQDLLFAGNEDGKLLALKNLIKTGGLTPPALIFMQSIDRAKDLNRELLAYNVKSDLMHSERSKEDRDQIVHRFAEGEIWVLVCTDVMSRGIDFRGVELVINYDFPQSVQSYIHRIGRTGRAGRTGKAITFFTKDDASYLRSIVNVMRNSGCDVPAWMLSLKAPSQNQKKNLRQRPVNRKDVSSATGSVGGGKGDRRKKQKGNEKGQNKGEEKAKGDEGKGQVDPQDSGENSD